VRNTKEHCPKIRLNPMKNKFVFGSAFGRSDCWLGKS